MDYILPFDTSVYRSRRAELMRQLSDGQILLMGNKNSPRNYTDNHYKFRQDSSFLYYGGIADPGLIMLLDVSSGKTTLFGKERTIDNVIWSGHQPSLADKAQVSGIDEVRPLEDLDSMLRPGAMMLPNYRHGEWSKLQNILSNKKAQESEALITAVIKMRSLKTAAEITYMDEAVNLSNDLHRHLIKQVRTGLYEYDLYAQAMAFTLAQNCTLGYNAIITVNGHILHNEHYNNQLKQSDLLLFDGGIEIAAGYTGDLTRTVPVSGHFSGVQSDIYQIVHQAYKASVAAYSPTATNLELHLAASRAIAEGLIALGWMKGDIAEALAAGAHAVFFPHGIGHMIGLDVHDMENLGEDRVGYSSDQQRSEQLGLKSLRLAKKLEVGNCITIEPGIYVIPELLKKMQKEGRFIDFINYDKVAEHHDFGGIRLEDDFVITDSGIRKLGSDLSISVEEVEALLAS